MLGYYTNTTSETRCVWAELMGHHILCCDLTDKPGWTPIWWRQTAGQSKQWDETHSERDNRNGWKPQTAWRARVWEQGLVGNKGQVKKGRRNTAVQSQPGRQTWKGSLGRHSLTRGPPHTCWGAGSVHMSSIGRWTRDSVLGSTELTL